MDDINDILGWPVEPDPLAPAIPTIEVAREWPYFDEDVDRDSPAVILDELESLWFKTSSATPIDDPQFHAPNATFRCEVDGVLSEVDVNPGSGAVAIANLDHLAECWRLELHRDAIRSLPTTPSAAVVSKLLEDRIGQHNAWNILRFQSDNERAIAAVEQVRQRIVDEVGGTIETFLASLGVAIESPPVANPKKPTASVTDRDRWTFAKPYRDKTRPIPWEKIAEFYRKETGDNCGGEVMRQSWCRVNKADKQA